MEKEGGDSVSMEMCVETKVADAVIGHKGE